MEQNLQAVNPLLPGNGINKPHPLQQPLILYNLFEKLNSDPLTLKTCRLVSREWAVSIHTESEIPILISKDILEFNDLLSSPDATLVCRKVTLGPTVNAGDPATILFLQNFGSQMRQLKIQSEIEALQILLLPQLCSNLTRLEIKPKIVSPLEIPTMLQEAWNNPFPQLRSLAIHSAYEEEMIDEQDEDDIAHEQQPDYANNIGQFIIIILAKAVKLTHLSLIRFDCWLWNSVATLMLETPGIQERLNSIELGLHQFTPLRAGEDLQSLWTYPELQLRRLVILNIPGVTTQMLSTALETENLKGTLEELHIPDYDTIGRTPDDPIGCQLQFTNVMDRLKILKINGSGEKLITSSEPGSIFQNLQNLEIFHFEDEKLDLQEVTSQTFWNNLLPTEEIPNPGFVHNKIIEFMSTVVIPNNKVEEFGRIFPSLNKCCLRVTGGTVMISIVTKLHLCPIRELFISYHETEEGLNEFAAAISGIAIEQSKTYWELDGQVQKIRSSLADWPSLKTLSVRYITSPTYFSSKESYVPLNRVCLERGFGMLTNLHKLYLYSFEIHTIQITTLLTKVPLQVLDLKACHLINWDNSRPLVPISTAVSSIREQFPRVQLFYNH